ncbi:hypothetical protein F5972_36450 [Microbispora cellulosiformans]|uniref:Uncharacterized protein n=1 Tax=Microbispora cellulosiformans TaxID=2614688 RepID=A0A5J5JR60_9ACTN|nr:hypothetical protein [Microbispora cellulosiformans]KAA9373158.1 hypothetical protein F5972_36450 [Microbispora cellulosiformans]
MREDQAFWIDARSDRERARGGDSRYAELLRDNIGAFDGVWGDIAPVAFACAAWRVATPPVASPGLVRWHRRILSASCARNGWDGSMIARISLVSPPPAALTASRAWWRDRGWEGWPEVFGQYVEPAERDLTKIPFVRPVLLVDAPLPLDDLPPAPDGPAEDLPELAHRALVVLVRELNRLIGPMIAQIESLGRSG